jgi:hypothetical protein
MIGFLSEVSESLGAFPRIRRLLDNATSWLGKSNVKLTGELQRFRVKRLVNRSIFYFKNSSNFSLAFEGLPNSDRE